MRKSYILIILLLITNVLFSNNKDIYLKLLKNKDFSKLIIHLENWEKIDPKNPEVFIGYFNYFISKDRVSGISIDKKPKGETELVITDPKTEEIVGYFNDSTFYNYEDIKQALLYINKGISYNPNRLDMHFGKIHILGEIKDYKNQSISLINLFELSIQNKNQWYWSDNEKITDGKNFLISNIQDYYSTWFNENTDESLESIKNTSIKQIKLYPSNIYGYNNFATYYLVKKQYNKALNILLKAEKINNKDIIIIFNIANCYKDLNNKEMAKIYYEKAIQIGDEKAADYAKQMLNDL